MTRNDKINEMQSELRVLGVLSNAFCNMIEMQGPPAGPELIEVGDYLEDHLSRIATELSELADHNATV